jgi:hypothetical protein
VRTAPAAERAAEQLLLADESSGRARYRLTGVRESELASHVGRRVEVAGTVEQPRTTPVLSTADGARAGVVNRTTPGAVGVTPDGSAAHEPSDALSATVPAGSVARPSRDEEREDSVDALPALNAASYRAIDGDCATPPSRAAADDTRVTAQASSPAPTAPARAQQPAAVPQPVTVRGCLVRQTASGTALSPQPGTSDALVLTKAALSNATTNPNTGVPGSTPDAGSGTIPRAVATSGAPADAATLTFALHLQASHRQQLLGHVGEQVELVGIVAEEPAAGAAEAGGAVIAGRAEAAKPDPAHPSAPARAITVSSFRAIGGMCN